MNLQDVIASLRDRGQKMLSLDNPQDQDLVDIGADIGAGFLPVVGQAQAARDFERARRDNDKFGMGLAAFGMIPFVGGLRKVGSAVKGAGKGGKAAGKVNLRRDGVPVSDLTDAEKRWGNGEKIYAFHEMDEAPSLVTSLEMLNNYTPDQLMALPAKAGPAASKAKVPKSKNDAQATVNALRGYDPAKVAADYPDRAPPVLKFDKKKGKEFLGKDLSAEAQAVQKARNLAQREINAGNYTPYFNVADRYYVDSANYPLVGDTLVDAMPKKQDTINKYKARFDTPEINQRLQAAFLRGNADPNAQRWYAMGQLEKVYVDELGEEAGRAAFKTDFADAMAATTGGADPTDNLMMAHYGNFLRARGEPIPENSYDFPFPIGGRYAGGNMEMYDKVINQGRDFVAGETPKRFNFSANFQGHKNRATIDEQMSGGFEKGLKAPPGDSYGVMEARVGKIAEENGVPPVEAQDVMWAGLKGTPGKPMIQHVNEAIERTSRITGLTPDEVLRNNLIRKMGPIYGIGAVGLGTAAYMNQDEETF